MPDSAMGPPRPEPTKLFESGPDGRPSGPVATADLPRPSGPDPVAGDLINHYQLIARLGEGGMGVVFEAEDTKLRRRVALKLLSRGLTPDPTARSRFTLEAQTAAKLTHPNAVSVYEVGDLDGRPFMVMELVRGGSCEHLIAAVPPVTWAESTRLIADACRALATAHEAGMVHRDVKPANILRTQTGEGKLADFGLAKPLDAPLENGLTQPGHVVGTPAFMSPEQCRAEKLDPRSDIYSLGATYHHLLTGKPPYDAPGSPFEVMMRHCTGPVPDPRQVDPDVPPGCAAIIARSMAKRREDRYQTAKEMLRDLRGLLAASNLSEDHDPPAPVRVSTGKNISAVGPDVSDLPTSSAGAVPSQAGPRDRTNPLTGRTVATRVAAGAASGSPGTTTPAGRRAGGWARYGLPVLVVAVGGMGSLAAVAWISGHRPAAAPENPGPASARVTLTPPRPDQSPPPAEPPQEPSRPAPPAPPPVPPVPVPVPPGPAVPPHPPYRPDDRFGGKIKNGFIEIPLGGKVSSVAFSPDGTSLAAGRTDGGLGFTLWKVRTGEEQLTRVKEFPVRALAFSPDGQSLAAGGGFACSIWLVPQGRLVAGLPTGELDHPVRSLAFSPDGRTLAAATAKIKDKDKTAGRVIFWDLKAKKVARSKLLAHTDRVTSMDFNPSSSLLVSVGLDKTVLFTSPHDGLSRGSFKMEDEAQAVRFAPDGQQLLVGHRRGATFLNVLGGGLLLKEADRWEFQASGMGVAFSADGRLAAVGTAGQKGHFASVRVWDRKQKKEIAVLPGHRDWVHAVSFSPDGRLLASASDDHTVRVWDLNYYLPRP